MPDLQKMKIIELFFPSKKKTDPRFDNLADLGILTQEELLLIKKERAVKEYESAVAGKIPIKRLTKH